MNYLHIFLTGTFIAKMKAVITFGASFSVAFVVFDKLCEGFFKWSLVNISVITIIALAIIIDHLLGCWVHAFYKRDFCWKKNILGLITKCGVTVAGFLIFEMLNHLLKDADFLISYFKITTNVIVFLYPATSAFVNLSIITNGAFPPVGWIKKIKKFQSSTNLTEFAKEKTVSNHGEL